MDLSRLVLTTGQAARCCLVSADTVVNWIKAGKLTAQKTVGGQYRIRLEDLKEFMREQGLDPVDSDPADARPMCWRFHADRGGASAGLFSCDDCLVKHLGVRDCFKLMGMRPASGRTDHGCEGCPYFQRWAAGRAGE